MSLDSSQKSVNGARPSVGGGRIPSASLSDDQFARTAATTPPSDDPLWVKLGSTRVIDPPTDDQDMTPPSGAPLPSNTPVVGATFGDFELLDRLGEGAMGTVFLARQISFERRICAVKFLFPHIAKQPRLVERLYREGRALAQLDHENIVQAYGVDKVNGCHYMAMEYIEGSDLATWLKKLKRLSVADALAVTLAIARGLNHAHASGIIHRDIKPENILISSTGQVKVADLGMVKSVDEDLDLTQTGHAVGTPWYMPLEQAKDSKSIDARSDIYALGCVLYSLLTGRPPFQGRTLVELIQAKERGTYPPARSQNTEVPEKLELIILKMTAKLPGHRYANCGDLIADLEKLGLAGRSLSFVPGAAKPSSAEDTVRTKANDTIVSPLKFDPSVWYVRVPTAPGKSALKKLSTEELKKLLAEGILDPQAQVSHFADRAFRAASACQEFLGVTSKAPAKATAATTMKYRELYEQFEQREEQREAAAAETQEHQMMRYYVEAAWKIGRIPLAVIVAMTVFWWLASLFR